MEAILFCYFDKVFSDLDRGCLLARHKRRETVEYFNTLIEGCSRGEECDPQLACGRTIRAAIDFHDDARRRNGGVCLLGKYHNILYVAIKLCYDWKLEDNGLVCELLKDVFSCEKTFERLLGGAIFGTRATHLISGWKSDFANRDECLKATEYFLDHAAKGNMMFNINGRPQTMVSIPMESYGRSSPARICVQAGTSDVLELLIKYGATTHPDPDHCALQLLLRRLQSCVETHPEKPLPDDLLKCLNVFIKIIPKVPMMIYEPMFDDEPIILHPAILAALPDDRNGFNPCDLQHLCRCVIRGRLARNGQLPYGVKMLNIPSTLQQYINFQG